MEIGLYQLMWMEDMRQDRNLEDPPCSFAFEIYWIGDSLGSPPMQECFTSWHVANGEMEKNVKPT